MVMFMKKMYLFLTICLSVTAVFAQEVCDTLYINMLDGNVAKYNVENIDSITFTPHALETAPQQPDASTENLGAAICWIDDDFLVDAHDIYKRLHDWCIEKDIRLDFALIPPAWSPSTRMTTAKQYEEEGFTFVMHPSHDGWYDDSQYTHDIVKVKSKFIQCMREFQNNIVSSRKQVLVWPGRSDHYQDNIDFVKNYVDCAFSATKIGTNTGNKIDRYSIKRFSLLIRNGYPKSKLKELIKEAVDRGDWIILYTHIYDYENTDVVDETTNSFANLMEIVEYANSLCPIRPVEAVWRERKEMYGF